MIKAEVEDANSTVALATCGIDFVMQTLGGRDYIVRGLAQGDFEPMTMRVFREVALLHPGLFYDVGANNGIYSIIYEKLTSGQVVAFEPMPDVRQVLEGNLKLNGSRADVLPVAVSDHQDGALLYVPTDEHGLLETSASLEAAFKLRHKGTIDVPTTTIDALGGKPALIKIDVEGHEPAVLRGAAETIKEHRPVILYEVIAEQGVAALNAIAAEHGYIDARLGPQCVVLDRVVRCDPSAWNHILWPAERLVQLVDLLARHGIPAQGVADLLGQRRHDAATDSLRSQLEAIQGSTTWRVTRPLRALVRLLRG